jgi:hypothetical protein
VRLVVSSILAASAAVVRSVQQMHIHIRKRLSYANVAATLALLLSMSGGALAASKYLINSTKQINPKVLTKLKGKTGPLGPAGSTGPTGPQGPTGPAGAPNPNAINATNATNATTATKLTPRGPFVDLSLTTGWVNDVGAGGTYKVSPYNVGYYIDREGFVHLRGAADRTSGTEPIIAILPAGARPEGTPGSSFIYFPLYTTGSTFGTIYIGADGSIRLLAGSAGFVSLDGVTFPQGN